MRITAGRRNALASATAIAAVGVLFASGVFNSSNAPHASSAAALGAESAGALALQPGVNVDVSCPNGLSNSSVAADSETVQCAPDPVTTTTAPVTTTIAPVTTTTLPAPTTTTVPVTTTTQPPVQTACPQFVEAPSSSPAFCDTLGTPNPTAGTRSGALNGVIWGVSHATDLDNPPGLDYQWAASTQNQCGTNTQVAPEHDVNMCGGHLVESANDNGNQTLLAMYPRQPFDFAGRTGTAEFDVTDNTQGAHSAWPTFVVTDQPVPAPNDGGNDVPAIADAPRNSIGVALDQVTPPSTCVTAQIWATRNYQPMGVSTHSDGCAQETSNQNGPFNHVEIQVNSTGVKVFMSDPGNPGSTRLIADASFSVPLTRGVAWMEDVHYNGNKFNSEQTDTMSWRNFAFDGPVLPRDLGFDIPDNTTAAGSAENGLPTANLGYAIPGGGSLTQTYNLNSTAKAAGALLEFVFYPRSQLNFSYKINGNALSFAWPYGSSGQTFSSQTIALPVPVADLHDGANTVSISTSDGSTVDAASFDMILAGAGGTP